jgi:hypothetical protein
MPWSLFDTVLPVRLLLLEESKPMPSLPFETVLSEMMLLLEELRRMIPHPTLSDAKLSVMLLSFEELR